jgi:hypothetical protein
VLQVILIRVISINCLVVRGDNGLGLVVIICIRVKSY